MLHSDAHSDSTPNQAIQAVWDRLTPFGVDFGLFSLCRPFKSKRNNTSYHHIGTQKAHDDLFKIQRPSRNNKDMTSVLSFFFFVHP